MQGACCNFGCKPQPHTLAVSLPLPTQTAALVVLRAWRTSFDCSLLMLRTIVGSRQAWRSMGDMRRSRAMSANTSAASICARQCASRCRPTAISGLQTERSAVNAADTLLAHSRAHSMLQWHCTHLALRIQPVEC